MGQERGKSGANALAGQMRGKCGRSGAQVRHTEQILIKANATYSLRHLDYWASCGRTQRCFHAFMLPLQLCSSSRSQKLVLLKASDKTCRHTCRPSPIWRSSIGPRASHAARLPLAIRMPAQTQWYVALRGATALPIYRIFTAVVHARMVVRDTLAVASPASALACMPRTNVGVDG